MAREVRTYYNEGYVGLFGGENHGWHADVVDTDTGKTAHGWGGGGKETDAIAAAVESLNRELGKK